MVALLRVADFSDKRSEWRLSANLNSHPHPSLPLSSARGATGVRCGVRLAVRGLRERHRYSRAKFTPTRATAFAEWRQLLSA